MPLRTAAAFAAFAVLATLPAVAQAATEQATPPQHKYTPTPSFDLSSIDTAANPCNDFYAFACGHYATNHPIPADQSSANGFSNLYNVETEQLSGILEKAEIPAASRTPNQQKIGDYYHACMDTAAIDRAGLTPVAPLLKDIDGMTLFSLAGITGKLQRIGVDVLFSFGEQQDFTDASKQIAVVDQGGLGMPERDFYLRTGAKDIELRKDYVAYITKLLTLSGTPAAQAATDAQGILVPSKPPSPRPPCPSPSAATPPRSTTSCPSRTSPRSSPWACSTSLKKTCTPPLSPKSTTPTPPSCPPSSSRSAPPISPSCALISASTSSRAEASNLPHDYDQASFDFYGRDLSGTEERSPRWKRCSSQVNGALGEALGEVYVQQYFAGDSKAKTLEMVGDIEHAMDRDLQSLDWMSPETKVRAEQKLHAIANKIGYPEHFRDYSAVLVKPEDPIGNSERATAFETDRQLNKIGKPVDHNEWGMTPPTVNAYYDPSMNDINFPAGILQPNFYDPNVTLATNYGHIGAVIGHELTHGFDDEGKKFDDKGNLADWWTPADTKKFEAKTDCLANQYSQFVAVDDVHVNGRLTLGENTADNGGLLLAYMAYLDRAKKDSVDINTKVGGFTGPQRFYIAWAQNWCTNTPGPQLSVPAP